MFHLLTIAFTTTQILSGYSFGNSELVGTIKYNLWHLIIGAARLIKLATIWSF